MNNIILKITKEISEETQQYNIALKKKKPGLNQATGKHGLQNFFWPCFDSMLPQTKDIHLKRTHLLYHSGAYQAPAEVQHDFFIKERLNAGWILADERLDYIWENDEMKWVGHDPYLQDLRLCPDWFQEWCVERNKKAEKVVKKYLTINQKTYN